MFSFFNCKENIQREKADKSQLTYNTVLIIDASASMLSIEFKPNRLEKIKLFVDKIIKSKKTNDKIAIIVFSENSKVLCNLTNDKSKLLSTLENINSKTYLNLGRGTNFEKAIERSIDELKTSNNKSIFLFTDGVYSSENNENRNYIKIEKLKLEKIKTNVLIMATNDIYNPPIGNDTNGNLLFGEEKSPKVDEFFPIIAKETSGSYVRFFNENEVNKMDITSFYRINR